MPHFVVAVEVRGSKRRHRGDLPWSEARAGPKPEVAAVLASTKQEVATAASSAAVVVGIIVKVMAMLFIRVPNRNWPSHLPIHFRNLQTHLDSGVFIMVLMWDRQGQTSRQLSGQGHPLASN